MKILWLCNVRFTNESIKASGTWLLPMAQGLLGKGDVELYSVAESRDVCEVQEEIIGGIHQFTIPWRKRIRYIQSLPTLESCAFVKEIVNRVKPDLIHVWGTESIWGYMNVRHCFDGYKTLLEIQGLSSSYSYYYGGLTFIDRLKTMGINEIIKPWRSIYFGKMQFGRRGKVELQVIRSFNDISYQSGWVKEELMKKNSVATLHATKIVLRDSFYTAAPWTDFAHNNKQIVFSICAGATPYKGTEILIKAISTLIDKFPNLELRLAGNFQDTKNGLTRFYLKEIHRLGIGDNVKFLGPIAEDVIVKELQNANVAVIPSFVETYCLAFAESMMVGTPTVAAKSAALPYLAEDMEEALFYSPKDYKECSDRIKLLLEDHSLSNRISIKGRERRLRENEKDTVFDTQYSIYKKILNK